MNTLQHTEHLASWCTGVSLCVGVVFSFYVLYCISSVSRVFTQRVRSWTQDPGRDVKLRMLLFITVFSRALQRPHAIFASLLSLSPLWGFPSFFHRVHKCLIGKFDRRLSVTEASAAQTVCINNFWYCWEFMDLTLWLSGSAASLWSKPFSWHLCFEYLSKSPIAACGASVSSAKLIKLSQRHILCTVQ